MSAEALKQEAHLQEAMSQRLAPGTQWPRIKKSLVTDFSRFLLLSYLRVICFFPLKIVLSIDHCFGKLIVYIAALQQGHRTWQLIAGILQEMLVDVSGNHNLIFPEKMDGFNLIPPRPPVSAALPSPPPWREAPAPRTLPQGFPAQQWHPRPHRYRWSHRHIMCLGWRSSGENLWGLGISRDLWWFNHH